MQPSRILCATEPSLEYLLDGDGAQSLTASGCAVHVDQQPALDGLSRKPIFLSVMGSSLQGLGCPGGRPSSCSSMVSPHQAQRVSNGAK